MSDNEDKVLKILCIHGYRQNAKTFRERTGAFRKIVKKRAELVFITAPNIIPPLECREEGANGSEEQRGWWFSREDNFFHAQDPSACVKGYEESLQVIKQAFKEQGPFDGILGFSQGASMLSLICGIIQQKIDEVIEFDFAILVAGFKSRSKPHDALYNKKITMPTLHVFGETDTVIEKAMSEELLNYFENPVVLQHPGGHFIPASGAQKKIYVDFLENMLTLKKSKLCNNT